MAANAAPGLERRRHLLILLAVWAAAQLLFGLESGARVVGDAPRYLDGADRLLAGEPLPVGTLGFVGLVALYALVKALGGGIGAVVALQVAVSGVAVWRSYAAGTALYSARAGFWGALLLAGWWEIQRRNFLPLTTSLFVSFTVIALAAVLTARRPRGYVLAAGLIWLVSLLRPEGVLLGVAAATFWLLQLARRRRPVAALLLLLALSAFIAGSAERAARHARHESIGHHYLAGTVIWGYEAASLGPVSDVPPSLASEPATVPVLAWMLQSDPLRVLRLGATRLGLFIVHVKPYYSARHNIFIALTLFPVYALAVVGVRRRPAIQMGRWLLAALFAGSAAFTALTWEDWDGRWLLHVMPVVFLWAGAGTERLLLALRAPGRDRG